MVAGIAVLVLLQVSLNENAAREVRLIDAPTGSTYEQMSRAEQRTEYRMLEAQRPGIGLPVLGTTAGGAGAILSAVIFWAIFTTPAGLAVYSAVILIAAAVVSLALMVGSIALYVVKKPQRDALGSKMHELEDAYREGRCRTEPGLPPCQKDPLGPPPPTNGFVPQVSAPAPFPSLVIARF